MKCSSCNKKDGELKRLKMFKEEILLCKKCEAFTKKLSEEGCSVEDVMKFFNKIKKNLEGR